MNPLDLSTSQLEFGYEAAEDRLRLGRFGLKAAGGFNVLQSSGLFAVYVDGRRYDAGDLKFVNPQPPRSLSRSQPSPLHERGGEKASEPPPQSTLNTFTGSVLQQPINEGGSKENAGGSQTLPYGEQVYLGEDTVLLFEGMGFEVEHHIQVYRDTALIEVWQVIKSTGEDVLHITRLDSFALVIAADDYEVMGFNSDWGQEFEPVRVVLKDELILETRKGRSSKGQHPYFALFHNESGQVLSGAVAWSGNWVCRFEARDEGGYRLSGGLHDWNFSKDLAAGESVESAHCVLVLGRDLNEVSQQYARVGRAAWYPQNKLSTSLPVEWNHWWSYEDVNINETVFLQNVKAAAQLGIEVCTLDAGWFGPSGETEWHSYRGDWELVNHERFPNGIRAIADAVHAEGMRFGLWCEIEGLGKLAALATEHPEFRALRDGEPLGYVCLGNAEAQEWAYQTLSRLIETYDCDWVKLDFNLDPEAGCNRVDHGHGLGDGLYEHVQG